MARPPFFYVWAPGPGRGSVFKCREEQTRVEINSFVKTTSYSSTLAVTSPTCFLKVLLTCCAVRHRCAVCTTNLQVVISLMKPTVCLKPTGVKVEPAVAAVWSRSAPRPSRYVGRCLRCLVLVVLPDPSLIYRGRSRLIPTTESMRL